MDRSSKQKMNMEIKALNDTPDQMDFTDIFIILQPKATEYTFSSSACEMFPRIDHILGSDIRSKLIHNPAYFQTIML